MFARKVISAALFFWPQMISADSSLTTPNTVTADYINYGSNAVLDTLSSKTIIAWVYPVSLPGGVAGRIIEKAVLPSGDGFGLRHFNLGNGIINSLSMRVNRSGAASEAATISTTVIL